MLLFWLLPDELPLPFPVGACCCDGKMLLAFVVLDPLSAPIA